MCVSDFPFFTTSLAGLMAGWSLGGSGKMVRVNLIERKQGIEVTFLKRTCRLLPRLLKVQMFDWE